MTDEEVITKDELEEADEPDLEEMAPIAVDDGEAEIDDSDEALVTESFSPVEGEEKPGEFDPEDPDAYLYSTPQVKYADSAEEDEGVWSGDDEF